MLTTAHAARDVRIYEKEAISLAEAGYDVTIVVPHDRDEKLGAIQVRGVARPNGRMQRMTETVWQVYRKGVAVGADVYHFHDPELIPVGALLKASGKRVVYDVHEDVPRDILVKDWIAMPLRKVAATGAEAAHYFSSMVFDGIVAATPTIAARFPGHRTVTVQNFPRVTAVERTDSRPYAGRPNRAIHLGLVDRYRGARQMVQAISVLPGLLRPQLLLAGRFDPPELERELKAISGPERLEVRGWVSRESVNDLLQEAKVGLALAQPWQAYAESQPNKLFEYMAAGLPVVASDFPVWREIVATANCGLLVDPSDARAIADAMLWIFEHPDEAEEMGQRGVAEVRSRYNWKNEEAGFLDLYARLGNGRHAH